MITFEVRAELPGVAKDDLHVSVKDNLLTLSGEKRQEERQMTPKITAELNAGTGSFQRRFTLPSEVEDRRYQSRIYRRRVDAIDSETGSRETDRGSDYNRFLRKIKKILAKIVYLMLYLKLLNSPLLVPRMG